MADKQDTLEYIRQHLGLPWYLINRALGVDAPIKELYKEEKIQCVYFRVGMGEMEGPNDGGWYATSMSTEEIAQDIASKIPYMLRTWRNSTWPNKS